VKKTLIAILGAILALSITAPVRAADVPDEQWSVMKDLFSLSAPRTGISLLGLSIQDNTNLSERVSVMIGQSPTVSGERGKRICKSIDNEFCKPGLGQFFTAFLPVCKVATDMNCLVGVSAVLDGREIVGEYSRNFPDKGYTDFPADLSKNIPEGSTPSLWKFAGLSHGGGTDEYLVSFMVEGSFEQDGKGRFNSYFATINPVTIQAGAWGRNEYKDGSLKPDSCVSNCGLELLGHSGNDKFVCAALADGYCALRQSFPNGTRFKVTARLSQSPTGWFHGRMKAPDIVLGKVDGGVSISVEAEPVSVPVVGVLEPYSKLPEVIRNVDERRGGFNWGGIGPEGRANVLLMPSPDSQEAFDAVIEWKDYIKDKANASPTQWAVRTLKVDQGAASCFKNTSELVGVVTTNSMVYLGTPPTFDRENQSLDYKVSSPHFNSKGEVFKGTYDLQLQSETARCLYGFSKAPISAKISIISDSGESNIATTVVNERDGWLRMAAYGFTFSSPTLKVKLSQEAEVVAPAEKEETVTAQVVTPSKVVKKTTITCIKGKTKKKVTAVKPKCPSGYKKAA